MTLDNANLTQANLSGGYFNGASFTGANLSGAIIHNANFDRDFYADSVGSCDVQRPFLFLAVRFRNT